MFSSLLQNSWIPYSLEEQELEEKSDIQDLSASIAILKDLGADIKTMVEKHNVHIEETVDAVESSEIAVQQANKELEQTKVKGNLKLKLAITTTCSVVGASVLSFPLIPLLGSYSLVSGAVGALCGGLLSSATY